MKERMPLTGGVTIMKVTTGGFYMNGMIIFLSATLIAIVAIILQRRRGGHQR